MRTILIWLGTLWFFVPISIANQSVGFARALGLPLARTPISEKYLGKGKTWGAWYVAPLSAIGVLYLQRQSTVFHGIELLDYQRSDLPLIGLLMGWGVVAGDQVASFLKRLVGIKGGDPWWPIDQTNYVVGALSAVMPITGWLGWEPVSFLLLFALPLHYYGNQVGYWLKLRSVPW